MYGTLSLVVIWICGIGASPFPETNSTSHGKNSSMEAPSTIVPWDGYANIPGAFIISRINLSFINKTCSRLSSDLDVALQVTGHLYTSRVKSATVNQLKRYGFIVFKLEQDFTQIMAYVTSLHLCFGRGKEIWEKRHLLNSHFFRVWNALSKKGIVKPEPEQTDRRVFDNTTSPDSNLTISADLFRDVPTTDSPVPITNSPISDPEPNLLELLEETGQYTITDNLEVL